MISSFAQHVLCECQMPLTKPVHLVTAMMDHKSTMRYLLCRQMLWTFSIYLESVAILPQLVMLQRGQNIDNLTGNYVFLLGYAAPLVHIDFPCTASTARASSIILCSASRRCILLLDLHAAQNCWGIFLFISACSVQF